MVDQAARTRADAIKGFADALSSLRESVGNPSFREMSGRSRAISHTTLHEAAQGNRLPSWATTVEFVKACGADPAAFRDHWEDADRAVRSASSPGPGAVQYSNEAAETAPPPVERDDEPPAPASPRGRRRPGLVLPAALIVAAVIAVVVVVALNSGGDSSGGKSGATDTPLSARLSPADCPVHQTNPPPAPPAHSGDASGFIADITLPDCTHIRRGQTVTKVWRLKNLGTVTWKGYSLHRLDLPQQRDQCQTISDVPIDDTAPGDLVDIKTQITAPRNPGFCFARFKMMDASGHVVFPGSRPVNFQVIVD